MNSLQIIKSCHGRWKLSVSVILFTANNFSYFNYIFNLEVVLFIFINFLITCVLVYVASPGWWWERQSMCVNVSCLISLRFPSISVLSDITHREAIELHLFASLLTRSGDIMMGPPWGIVAWCLCESLLSETWARTCFNKGQQKPLFWMDCLCK